MRRCVQGPRQRITDAAKQDLASRPDRRVPGGVTVAFGGGIVNQPTTKNSDALGLLIAYLVLTSPSVP